MKSLSFFTHKLASILGMLAVVALWLFPSCNKAIQKNPQIVVSAETLVFNGNETKELTLSLETPNFNNQDIYCDYRIYDYPEWIEINQPWGSIDAENPVTLRLTSSLDNFLFPVESSMTISSYYGSVKVDLKGIPENIQLFHVFDTLYFPAQFDSREMLVTNLGNVAMDFSIIASSNHINVLPSSGTIPVEGQSEVTVNINRDALITEAHPMLYVTVADKVDTVFLMVEKKLSLPNDVIDAEYAKPTDLLVYVGSDATLNIYHPEARSISSIPLSYAPLCVSVSPDGTKAVVGHDAHVTYVDLLTESVLTTNDISCDAGDIVLTDDAWTYVFPSHYSERHIHCINVSTTHAPETLHTGYSIYYGTKAKLHPSGKFIYGADNGLSPSNIEKYDIQGGTAVYLYESPYHGDYGMGGNLWCDENGERLFTKVGTVFKTNEQQNMDMVYNGKITLEGSPRGILWMEQLNVKNELYLVLENSNTYDGITYPPYVYVYNSDNLTYKTKIRIEDFFVGTEDNHTIYVANPYFVFANSNGEELYVIIKANGSGLLHEWAIQTIDRR